MDYRFIVGVEQNMPLAPHVAPYMSGNDNWEELLISNRLLLLRRSPRTRKPVVLQIGPKTNRTSCIGRHFDPGLWDQTWEKTKTNAMPVREKVVPPPEVQMKFSVKPNWVISSSETGQKVNHAAQKGSPRPNHFSSMVQMSNERF